MKVQFIPRRKHVAFFISKGFIFLRECLCKKDERLVPVNINSSKISDSHIAVIIIIMIIIIIIIINQTL
jgi:hypothetical protein